MTDDERAELMRLRGECETLREQRAQLERAREALAESEGEYRELLERAQEGIWAIDAAGITTFVNPCMTAMIGYDVAEVLGNPLVDYMDDEGRRKTADAVKRRQQGIADAFPFAFRHRDGHQVYTRINTWPLHAPDGEYRGAIAFVVDETQERRLEARLERAQKMESLAVMAGGVAHDFNNLLVGVLANAALARTLAPPESELPALLEQIEHSARSAAELTRQMLAYAGRSTLRTERIDLGASVRDISSLVRAAIPRGVNVWIDDDASPVVVQADPAQLRQVFMNLIMNAAESLDDGVGDVQVRIGRMVASRAYLADSWIDDGQPEGEYAWVEVEDAGRGMDAGTLARIFDPFFTTRETGRGLGLASVLGIVRAHGGALRIASQPGAGTCVRVLLPHLADPIRSTGPRPAVDMPSAPLSGRVLVVDDEAIVRRIAERVLLNAGFEVSTADDAESAIRMFGESPEAWVAVLLDVTLPDGNGIEVMQRMHAVRPELHVVLSTGYAAEGLSGAERAFAVLEKPWGPEQLVAAVSRAVSA